MSKEQQNQLEKVAQETDEQHPTPGAEEGEFKITVRKLEMPVRPRGVLAE
jgi:hypothetical protein